MSFGGKHPGFLPGFPSSTLPKKTGLPINGARGFIVLDKPGVYTFHAPDGKPPLFVHLIGAGAGGGGSDSANGAGGGGSGGVTSDVLTDYPDTVVITVGAKGLGGNQNVAGSSGGTTSFGSLLTAPGGFGGASDDTGAGGAAGNNAGQAGTSRNGADGGSGGAIPGWNGGPDEAPATRPGTGGAGGDAGEAGKAGEDGLVIIIW